MNLKEKRSFLMPLGEKNRIRMLKNNYLYFLNKIIN